MKLHDLLVPMFAKVVLNRISLLERVSSILKKIGKVDVNGFPPKTVSNLVAELYRLNPDLAFLNLPLFQKLHPEFRPTIDQRKNFETASNKVNGISCEFLMPWIREEIQMSTEYLEEEKEEIIPPISGKKRGTDEISNCQVDLSLHSPTKRRNLA